MHGIRLLMILAAFRRLEAVRRHAVLLVALNERLAMGLGSQEGEGKPGGECAGAEE